MTEPIQRIVRLPRPARKALRSAVWAWGRATAAARPLPDFLVIGAQRAGTTALYAYLRRHPSVSGPAWKEVNFFDLHWRRGERWYRGNFPLGGGAMVGEASPGYLFHPQAAGRAASLLPHARLVALLRNPVDRALSHYHHQVALRRESLSFEEALDAEEERLRDGWEASIDASWWNHAYVGRGLYAEQLERWLSVFPAEQLLVLASEDLFAAPAGAYGRVLAHLGAEPHELGAYPRVFGREYGGMAGETRRRLEERFAEPNRRLEALLGRGFGW